jgi:hypothetical protein
MSPPQSPVQLRRFPAHAALRYFHEGERALGWIGGVEPVDERQYRLFIKAGRDAHGSSTSGHPAEVRPANSHLVDLRTSHFGDHHEGLVTFLICHPDDLVLVVRLQWLGD